MILEHLNRDTGLEGHFRMLNSCLDEARNQDQTEPFHDIQWHQLISLAQIVMTLEVKCSHNKNVF